MKLVYLLISILSCFVAVPSFAKPAYLVNNQTTVTFATPLAEGIFQNGKNIPMSQKISGQVYCLSYSGFDTVPNVTQINKIDYSVDFQKGLGPKTHELAFAVKGKHGNFVKILCRKEDTASLRMDSSEIQKAFGVRATFNFKFDPPRTYFNFSQHPKARDTIAWKVPISFQPSETYLFREGKIIDVGRYKTCSDCVSIKTRRNYREANFGDGSYCYVDDISTTDRSLFDEQLNIETGRQFYTYLYLRCDRDPTEDRNLIVDLVRPADNVRAEPSFDDLKRHLKGFIY